MITTNNYFREIENIGVDNLPEVLRKSHDLVAKMSVNGHSWAAYRENENIHRVFDLYFKKLDDFASHREKKGEVKEPVKKESKAKAVVKRTVRKAGTDKPRKTKKPVKVVHRAEHLTEEMKYIKRYAGLHNRVKSPNAILNFLKALQKSIVQKIITKTSPYAPEIRLIQENLLKAYNVMTKEALFEIKEKELSRMVAIAGGEEVYASIPVIKRYIGMKGKTIQPAKVNTFISHIKNMMDKDKLKDDPYEDKVKTIFNSLKKYIEGKQAHISVSETELNGFEKLLKHCGCHHHHALNGKHGKHHYKKHRQLHGLSGIMTAEEVANQHFDLLPFSGRWQQLIGSPAKNFIMMLHGEPGSGKTTFMLKFVKYLCSFGKVLYVSSEEYNSATLTMKVREHFPNLSIPSNLHFSSHPDVVNTGDYDFVILDSVNDLGLDLQGFKAMRQKSPDTAFIFTLQHTKNGQFRGGKEWEHEAEIAGEVSDGKVQIYKNRYGVKGSMDFFNQ